MSKELDDLINRKSEYFIEDPSRIRDIINRLGKITLNELDANNTECEKHVEYIISYLSERFYLDYYQTGNMKLEETIYLLMKSSKSDFSNSRYGGGTYSNNYNTACSAGVLSRALCLSECYEVRKFMDIDFRTYLNLIDTSVAALLKFNPPGECTNTFKGQLQKINSGMLKSYYPAEESPLGFIKQVRDYYLEAYHLLVESLFDFMHLETKYEGLDILVRYQTHNFEI